MIRTLGFPVVVDGADDFSRAPLWTPYQGDVWLASDVVWAPAQVFLDGTRLTAAAGGPASLQTGEFLYAEGAGLYVNAGGDNPGLHETLVGRRNHGFRLPGRSWVTIDGFSVTRTNDKAIYLLGSSNHVTLSNNTVSYAAGHGIGVVNSSGVVLRSNVAANNGNHGIAFTTGVTASTIENNEAYGNARPAVRAANGIYLYNSSGNVIRNNRVHHNQDTGVEITTNSNDNASLQNVSWSNGDHGFHCIGSTGTIKIGDVAWGNQNNGFSVEGGATGTHLHNCISIDNGLTTGNYNLLVDSLSAPGFASDHNIYWNSIDQMPVKFRATRYARVENYSVATGHDLQSIQLDPGFVDPAGGDFHVQPGSPAIDSGDASSPLWPALDAEGQARFDDPLTANTGVGPITYADRGAFEYIERPLAVGDRASLLGISLSGARPNPSAGSVAFTLEIPRAAEIEWNIHDLQGRRVWGEARQQGAGPAVLRWSGQQQDGTRVHPGLYFASLRVEGVNLMRRVIMLR